MHIVVEINDCVSRHIIDKSKICKQRLYEFLNEKLLNYTNCDDLDCILQEFPSPWFQTLWHELKDFGEVIIDECHLDYIEIYILSDK